MRALAQTNTKTQPHTQRERERHLRRHRDNTERERERLTHAGMHANSCTQRPRDTKRYAHSTTLRCGVRCIALRTARCAALPHRATPCHGFSVALRHATRESTEDTQRDMPHRHTHTHTHTHSRHSHARCWVFRMFVFCCCCPLANGFAFCMRHLCDGRHVSNVLWSLARLAEHSPLFSLAGKLDLDFGGQEPLLSES